MAAAQKAQAAGASRFCMGAAWRVPKNKDISQSGEMVAEVSGAGAGDLRHTGHVDAEQAANLKDAGLDYYNHNLDSLRKFYVEVISTRTYQDRLDTLKRCAMPA